MKFVVYFYPLIFLVCTVAAFYNIALGKNFTGYDYNPLYTTIHTGNLTDGDSVNTCESFNGNSFFIWVDLGKTYSIKSSVLIVNGNHSGNMALQYYDESFDWPFYAIKTYAKDIPQQIELDVQLTGRNIYFYFWESMGNALETQLCEIQIYGCETDHFGSDCQPCIKNDNCEVCDVNNGDCYVCKEGYMGPNCSMSTDNVALQTYTYMYHYNVNHYYYLNSYLLVDGDQSSCIDFKSYLNETEVTFYVDFGTTYNIKSVRLYLIHEGVGDIFLNYTAWNGYNLHYNSGLDRISANSSEVIFPFPHQVHYVYFTFNFLDDKLVEVSDVPVLFCEMEISGCPANHAGSPCRPCPVHCDQCNAIDGSCVCQAGYKGENCTEKCSNNTYGINCVYNCGHCFNETCDHVTGTCVVGCERGWRTNKCNAACSAGWYGQNCATRCSSHCITPHVCDRFTGSCIGGCAAGWTNDTCDSGVDWAPSYASVAYHDITWKEERSGSLVRYDPAVTLVCNFTLKSDEDLFYDVTWFIDGLNVLNQTVDLSSNYTAVMTAHDILKAQKKIGSDVSCKVGAKRKVENVPCLFKAGNPFFAGIKIVNPTIELERKGSSNVELEMTIPFASESLYFNGIPQAVSDLNIHMTFKTDDSSKCSGGGSSNQCEVKVKGHSYSDRHKYQNDEWRQNISFPVYSQDTDGYVINSQMTLRLKTGGTNGVGSKIFEHVPLPEISIRVRETNEAWKGRSCGVRADPHMYTFDGKSYECQIPGQYINYRNQRQLQWIQSKHHLCFPSYDGPWCVCAVAARVGRDVFVIDLCGESGVINFEMCEDNVLRVTKVYDNYYKVYFPTGTSLSIYIMEWRGYYNIDLEILPSAPDVGNADGLCGYFDGVLDNDFRRRDSNFTDSINLRYPNDFSDSWRIRDSENLFSGDSSVLSSLESVSTILVPHCVCTDDGKTECSYNTFTPCSSNRGKQYNCNDHVVKNRRRKRDVSGADPLQTRNITFVKTTEYAESVCLQAFQESSEYSLCQQHVTDLSNVTVSNCIEDIKMTGDDNLTQIHVEAALQQCSTFVLLNATLQESEPEVTYTIENICPNNCSSHGTCEGGNCTCNSGYGGSDCSFDLLGPPTITDVPSAGLCDLSTTSCNEATIMGKYFFENMDSNCYLSVHQVDVNHTIVQEEQLQLRLEERTLFEGYCPLPVNTSGVWTTEIKFNISNDGVRFTDTYNVFIYQSKCQEYHNESGNVFFTLKDEFCFIDSACVRPMENSTTNECLVCNSTNDQYQWTDNEDCGQTTTESIWTTTVDITSSTETESESSTVLITDTITYSTPDTEAESSTALSTDTITDNGPFTDTITDSTPFTDTITDITPFTDTITDSTPFTDTITDSTPFADTITDITPFTDTITDSTPFTDTITDSTPFTDTITDITPFTDTITDSTPFTDTITDSTPFTDTVTDSTPFTDTITDSTPFADTITVSTPFTDTITDSTPETEADSSTAPFPDIITDNTPAEDTIDTQTISTVLSTQTDTFEVIDTTLELSTTSEFTPTKTETIYLSSSTTGTTKSTSTASESTTLLDTKPTETTDDKLSTATTKITSVETTSISSETDTTGIAYTSSSEVNPSPSEDSTIETASATTRSTTGAASTTEKKTKDTEEPTHSPVTNTHLAIGVSVTIFGLLALFVIVGMVARLCKKPNKQPEQRQDNGGQSRNWRDLLISTKQDDNAPRYYGDSFIPHAPLHHFKSLGGSHRNDFNNKYQKY